MKRSKYFAKVQELYDTDQVSGDVYDAMIMNADEFCDDDEDDDDDEDNHVALF